MTGAIADAIQAIEVERDRLTAAINTLRGLTRGPVIPGPAVPRAAKVVTAPKVKSDKKATAHVRKVKPPVLAVVGRTARVEEIRRRIKDGESDTEVAAAVGVTAAAVYQHRRKMVKGGAAISGPKARKPKEEPASPTRFRCAGPHGCGQYGVDPKHCEHCGEKR